MMTCHDVETFLDDYLDRKLSWGTRLRFEFHIRMCAECKRYIARYRRAIELGQRLLGEDPQARADEAVPDDLVDAILKSVSEDT